MPTKGFVDIDIESISNDDVGKISGSSTDLFSNTEVCNHLDPVFRFLGKNDRDIVYMFFLIHKRQNDIAMLLSKTQAAVSYDTNRIKRQINYVLYLLSVVDDFVSFLESKPDMDSDDIDILTLMFFTSSYTKSAKIMGVNQITFRNKFLKILNKMNGYDDIKNIFLNITKNLNKIKKNVIPKSRH